MSPELKQKQSGENDFVDSITSLSSHDISVETLPDGRRSSVQQVDGINFDELEGYAPQANVPQEFAWKVGEATHVIFSGERSGDRLAKMREKARREGIPTSMRTGSNSDPRRLPWVHIQYASGRVVGIEEVAPDIISTLTLREGQPIADGQPPVTNLQARFIEDKPKAETSSDPDAIVVSEAALAGKVITGIAKGFYELGGHVEDFHGRLRARASELGVPVSKLSTEEMNRILKSR